MIKSFIEKENFLNQADCDLLINYQKLYSSNDDSDWSQQSHDENWEKRIVVCDKLYDKNVRDIIESVHYQASILCAKFYNEDVIYPEFSNLVYWGGGMKLDLHADNVFINDPQTPHYASNRDYSAVLYLNEEFEGGETYFKYNNYQPIPKTGKLILFTSDEKDAHGVREITVGKRYTLALWFTKSKKHIFTMNMEYNNNE